VSEGKFDFELFTPDMRLRAVPNSIHVTLGKDGTTFYISSAAFTQLGKPRDVAFLFDRARRTAAIRAAQGEQPGTYKTSSFPRRGGALVGGRSFSAAYDISPGRYDGEITDSGLLLFPVVDSEQNGATEKP
jgi:hypothetical protein